MNKYKQAYDVIDAVIYLIDGRASEEVSKAMADLKELVEKENNNGTERVD